MYRKLLSMQGMTIMVCHFNNNKLLKKNCRFVSGFKENLTKLYISKLVSKFR